MPVGYGARCKICNSEPRAEAEAKHERGESNRVISAWLKSQDVDVSAESVRKHMANHFPIREEAAQRYAEQSESVMSEAVDKRLNDLQMLDSVIERQYRMHTLAGESIDESLTTEFPVILKNGKPLLDPDNDYNPVKRKFPPAKQMVDLFNGAAAEIRQSIKLKAELLGDKDPDGATTIIVGMPEGYEADDDS
jgi:hypothetical protein